MAHPPTARFRVHPEGKYLYALVNIWPTKDAMYDHKPLERNHEACCTGQEVFIISDQSGKLARKDGQFAELNFCLDRLGVGVVSHEMTHATFCWAERIRLPIQEIKDHSLSKTSGILAQDGPEERFCYALGEMVRQFTKKCYDLKLYKDIVTT